MNRASPKFADKKYSQEIILLSIVYRKANSGLVEYLNLHGVYFLFYMMFDLLHEQLMKCIKYANIFPSVNVIYCQKILDCIGLNYYAKVTFFSVKTDIMSDASNDRSSMFWNLPETRLYIVLGCIAALIVVAVIQAGCAIHRARTRSKAKHKVTSL